MKTTLEERKEYIKKRYKQLTSEQNDIAPLDASFEQYELFPELTQKEKILFE